MSNAIRFDALLLAALAAELNETLRGARIARAWLDRTARVLALELGERRARRTLSWNLHPAAGQLALRAGVAAERGALLQVKPGTPVVAASALPDERILRLELAPEGPVQTLVVELIGNRWNVLALGADQLIRAVLLRRTDPPRELRAGVRYRPPASSPRGWIESLPDEADWLEALGPVRPPERTRALLSGFAWSSPLNARWILGDAAVHEVGAHVLTEAYARYCELRAAPTRPLLLPGGQPYVHALGTEPLFTSSLLDAFARASAGAALPALGAEALRDTVRARLYERETRIATRAERVQREAADASAEAERQRAAAQLLLARLHQVPRGAAAVELEGFTGERVRLSLDPARSAQQNAQQLYDAARRRDRAAARAPELLARAERELARIRALRARLDADDLPAAELRAWAARAERPARAATLPYRSYRTSGGLEVRVGRSARANDALTAQHAAPEDIWLHARDVGGAHVVLRWGRRNENPPHADLVEAAVLAALHSRARTSGTVPVDWTRRKHVRKPRKAPPGLVVPERVRTLFVEPDAALEERLREEEPD